MARRIAYFVDTEFFGGAERLIVDLCAEAVRRGDQPILLHFGHRELSRQVEALGVEHRVLPARDAYKSRRTVHRFARVLRGILREDGFDVLHSHLFGPVVAGALATAASHIRHIGTLHDSYTFDDRPWLAHAVAGARLLGTRVVAVSDSVRASVQRVWSGSLTGIRVVENGVAIPRFPPEPEIRALRESLALSTDARVVCAVARMVPIKGLNVLLDAWATLPAGRAQLILVGEGPDRSKLEAQAHALGVSDAVHFLGFRQDVSRLLFASDLFVLPSFSEGLSCSLLEAMAHGLPCVATRVGGNGELVDENATGLLVEPGQADELASALGRMLYGHMDLRAMGRAARTKVAERYSQKSTFDRYWSLYTGRTSS